MKIGASYWMFEGGLEASLPIVDAMQKAKDIGYESIELCIASEGVLTHETSKSECEVLVSAAKDIGIEISSVASGQSWQASPTSNDPSIREKILKFTQRALQVTNWLGTDTYLLVPGAVDVFFLPNFEVVPYEICYERANDFIAGLLPTAEQTGVSVAVENVWNKFLLSPLEMRDFIDSFGSDKIGSYFDVGNVLQTGYPDQWIKILGERIKRVHIKDFKLSVGTAEGFVDLGEGDVNFEAVKKALGKIGYDSYLTAEMIPFEPGRPEKTAEFMKRVFK